MGYNFNEIFNRFKADGTFLKAEPYGSGHIHDAFRIDKDAVFKISWIFKDILSKYEFDLI